VRIGYISADFGVDAFGFAGNSVHVRELIEALRRAGHAISLVSPGTSAEPAIPHRFRPDGPPVDWAPLPPDPHHVELFRQLEALDDLLGMRTRVRHELRNLLYNLTLRDQGLTRLRAAGVDFIYERYAFASFAGVRLARQLGVPHLLEVNAPLVDEQQRRAGVEMGELARELERQILCDSDHVFAVSRAVAGFAHEQGVAPERVTVLPNAVDPERFTVAPGQRDAARARLGLADRCVIGFVGGLKPFHGTELLIEAFAQLRPRDHDLQLLIVGDGPEGTRLRALAAERDVAGETTFTGRIPHSEVPAALAAMDIAVAPGVPDEFYFSPIKLFEYMAAGLAVVAGGVGQPLELVADGRDGRLFAPGDAVALRKVLEELVRDPAMRRRLGEAARQRIARDHTWDRNAQTVVAVARELATSGQ
jgi:glycosyltransferase involved in cell wall biosynthesis